jgi:hypothetical protein
MEFEACLDYVSKKPKKKKEGRNKIIAGILERS